MKMTRIYPKSLTFTPAGGTAVTLDTFQDAASFNITNTYGDSVSQSDLMMVGRFITGTSATLRVVAKHVTTEQFAALAGADYDPATETIEGKITWDTNYGSVTLVGYDTDAQREVTVRIEKTVPVVNGDLTFSKDNEVTVGIEFAAVAPDTDVAPYSITPAVVTP